MRRWRPRRRTEAMVGSGMGRLLYAGATVGANGAGSAHVLHRKTPAVSRGSETWTTVWRTGVMNPESW